WCPCACRNGRGADRAVAGAHRARDPRAQSRARGAGAGRHSHARRAAGPAPGAHDPRDQPARDSDRHARHHALPRRPDAHRRRRPAGRPPHRDSVLHRRHAHPAGRRRPVYRADDSRGARRADRVRPAQGHPADRARRPRPPRAADQGRLRRQEPADVAVPERAGAPHRDRRPGRSGDPRVVKKDLLSIDDLTSDEIYLILDTTEAMREIGQRPIKKVPTLRGKTIVNLFYEASTRTRTSFEIAEKRLSADTLNIAVATSSVLKGETLADTALNIEAMAPDMIVMRHASSGAGHLLSRICRSRIINAGDGMHEHPTQALLDAFTIREHKKR